MLFRKTAKGQQTGVWTGLPNAADDFLEGEIRKRSVENDEIRFCPFHQPQQVLTANRLAHDPATRGSSSEEKFQEFPNILLAVGEQNPRLAKIPPRQDRRRPAGGAFSRVHPRGRWRYDAHLHERIVILARENNQSG